MSDCDWLGMDVFGTQVLSPGPSELPSTVLQTKSASVEQAVSVTQAGTAFTTVLRNATDPLTVTLTRAKKNRPVLVSVNLTGRATGGFTFNSDLAFRTLVNTASVFVRPGDASNPLLVRKALVDLQAQFPSPFFEVAYQVLVPPEVLPDVADLAFIVQFQLQAGGTDNGVLAFDPKQDALVVQEIGPFTL